MAEGQLAPRKTEERVSKGGAESIPVFGGARNSTPRTAQKTCVRVGFSYCSYVDLRKTDLPHIMHVFRLAILFVACLRMRFSGKKLRWTPGEPMSPYPSFPNNPKQKRRMLFPWP